MAQRVRDLIQDRLSTAFVGRKDQLDSLLDSLEREGPVVVQIHGMAGIGKSALLARFAERAREAGATVVLLDCRTIEPTAAGFLRSLRGAIGGSISSEESAASRLGELGDIVVLALDTFELFRLSEGWLRQDLVPALPDNVRLVLAGREPPASAWWTTPGWQGLFRDISLGPLREDEAEELAVGLGIPEEAAHRVNRMVRGHPLGLTVAAAAWSGRSGVEVEDQSLQRAMEELTQLYLTDLDPLTRRVLHAASVLRRTTLPLLEAMLPETAPQDAFERLRSLPFVEATSEGLMLHETVQQVIAGSLRAEEPVAHQRYRMAAWHLLRAELHRSGPSDLWRYTADTLYILDNPAVREAFFPTTAHVYSVESARPEDAVAIEEITRRHEPPESAAILLSWWDRLQSAFRVLRDRKGEIVGVNVYCRLDQVPHSWLNHDPIARAWAEHLRRHPVPPHQTVLCYRSMLDRETGTRPSDVQGAAWLDIKRKYMEMRPNLRRLYSVISNLEDFGEVSIKLGFELLPEGPVSLAGVDYHLSVLDFGPSSVDGWLTWLVSSELGVEHHEDEFLDVAAHQVMVDGERTQLTPREFEVLHYLVERTGRPVTRFELLRDVWGYDTEVGSNVVEATIRSVRHKLRDRAVMVETLRGVGYRFAPDRETSKQIAPVSG